jgi:hypothetical protein
MQAYINLFLDMTSSAVPELTKLGSSLSMYEFFVYGTFFLIAYFVNSSLEATFQIALVY